MRTLAEKYSEPDYPEEPIAFCENCGEPIYNNERHKEEDDKFFCDEHCYDLWEIENKEV